MSGSELIRTKLAPPLAGGSVVDRADLLGELSQGLACLLTVLVAPAGFGKTTLLAAWHAALGRQGTACGWVTLDRDDDLYLFGAYILEALAGACDGVGRRAQALIRNDPLAPAKNVVSVLINEIAEAGRPIVLILDDLDRLESAAAHEALFRLLRHGPDNLHVVVAGRSEPPLPLSHFRSRNQLLYRDADSLRFGPADSGRFLREVAGLRLDAARVDALWQATEGWITGLQLASLALGSGADTAGIEACPRGATREIAQYLTENVLATLPPRLVDFLLRLSVLDRISPALGAAVSGFDDAAALLEELERRNLFLAHLDAARSWYRFHALFADYLRDRAQRQIPTEIPALHRRASAWLAGQRLWPEAVKHALAAGDEDAAAAWVEHSAMALIERSDLRTLRTWLGRLPPHVLHGRLRLRLAQAWCHALSLRPREAVATLHSIQDDLARGTLDTADDAALRCELLAMRALIAGLTDDSPASLRLAGEVLAMAPAEGSWVQRMAQTAQTFGQCYADADGRRALRGAEEPAPRPADGGEPAYAAVYRKSMLGLGALVEGRIFEAEQRFDHALRLAEEQAGRSSSAAALPAGYLGAIHYEWNEVARAGEILGERFGTTIETSPIGSLTRFCLTAARLAALRGERDEAYRTLEQAAAVARDRDWLRMLTACEGERVRLLVEDAALARASRVVQALAGRMPATPPAPPGSFTETHCHFELARSRLLMARGAHHEAAAHLEALGRHLDERGMAYFAARTHILHALALDGGGARQAALAALAPALAYGQRNGLVRSFIDEGEGLLALLETLPAGLPGVDAWYLADLLGAGGRADRQAAAALAPLSARERDILAGLARGLSNKEIARTLQLAPETVKWHLKNVFLKLNVTSRLQAVRWARTHTPGLTPSAPR